MAWIWGGLVVIAAGIVLAVIRMRFSPSRTAARLSVPVVVLEQVCADALGELQRAKGRRSDDEGLVFTQRFERGLGELAQIRFHEVAALGRDAALDHRQLVTSLIAWNSQAGTFQPPDSLWAQLVTTYRAAEGLRRVLPAADVAAATALAQQRPLMAVVAAPAAPGEVLH